MEHWRPVVGYEGAYEVSDLGNVHSVSRLNSRGRACGGKLLQPRKAASGHYAVALYASTTRRDVLVHHLVLEAFVGPRPDGLVGCHWNDDPADNRLENLRWDTRAANAIDSVRNGRHARANLTHCPNMHAYTPDNTYVYPTGGRACRECRRAYRSAHLEEIQERQRLYMRRIRATHRDTSTKTREVA